MSRRVSCPIHISSILISCAKNRDGNPHEKPSHGARPFRARSFVLCHAGGNTGNPARSNIKEFSMSQLENRKYVSFSHTFSDPWSGENAEEAQDVTLSFRFAKPTKLQIQRLQDKAAKNAGQASRNLVLDCVHPDDKQALTDAMEEYPGIATSFATAIIKGVGISAELGN